MPRWSHPWFAKTREFASREWSLYAVATAVCVAALFGIFGLHRKDLSAPLYFDDYGDALFYFMQAKVLLETGWVFEHPGLGAPYGMAFYDFPQFDTLHLFLWKAIGLACPNWAVVINVFFLLTFVLTTWTTLYLLRYLNMPGPIAIALALLYAFQHYHLHRGQGHLMLAAYYHVPLLMLVIVWLLEPRGLGAEGGGKALYRVPRFWAALVICALGALGGHYYACFAVAFFLVAGLYQLARWRRGRVLAQAGLVTAVVFVSLAVNLMPNWLYWREYGANRDISSKAPAGPELFGLKITQMVLPIPGHRAAPLAALTNRYYTTSPTINENATSHLGATASAGYLLLIVLALFPFLAAREGFGLYPLAALTLAGTLIGTTGGLMSLFGYLVSPQLHGVNRISIFLALFGLIAFGWCLTACLGAIRHDRTRLAAVLAAGVALTAGGLYDQTTRTLWINLKRADGLHARDAAFGRAIQDTLPAGSRVFLMPVGAFPGSAHRMRAGVPVTLLYYDHVRIFLHTHGLCFNQPCMMNRKSATWNQKVAQLPPEELLQTLALTGFTGLVLDTKANQKEELEFLAWLEKTVGPPVASDGVSRHFFDLRPYVARQREAVSPAEWQRLVTDAMPPVELQWGPTFQTEETGSEWPQWRRWRWSVKPTGEVALQNFSDHPVQVRFSMTLYAGSGTGGTFTLSGKALAGGSQTCADGERWEQTLTLPPGRHVLTIRSKGRPVRGVEGRRMWFRIEGLDYELLRPE